MYRHVVLLAAALLQVSAQQLHDGGILTSRPWPALPPYDSLDDFSRNYFPKQVYEDARTQRDFHILDITYASDGIPVRGILLRPKTPGDQKWPAIVFARGGTGDYGRITLPTNDTTFCKQEHTPCLTIVDLFLLAKAGFVVIASDYRFHDATAKRDEWGGGDVNDLVNLIPALRSIDAVDKAHVFMLGVSRGGTMTYLALKRGAPVRAAAVVAGVSDLETWGRYRPEFINGDETYDRWAKVWPDYATRSAEYYRDRSAVYWADKLTVPILILHSRQDRLVPVDQALRMVVALQAAGRTYALHVYANDGHSLPQNKTDRNRQIVDWFRQAK